MGRTGAHGMMKFLNEADGVPKEFLRVLRDGSTAGKVT